MPFVKWRKSNEDLTPETEITLGRSVLVLSNITNSSNYTCVASSALAEIESHSFVRVLGEELERAPINIEAGN